MTAALPRIPTEELTDRTNRRVLRDLARDQIVEQLRDVAGRLPADQAMGLIEDIGVQMTRLLARVKRRMTRR